MLVRRGARAGSMSDREIRDELLTLLIPATRPRRRRLSWAFERLLRHPEQLRRVLAEVELEGDGA